jgi:hypothetical protein
LWLLSVGVTLVVGENVQISHEVLAKESAMDVVNMPVS